MSDHSSGSDRFRSVGLTLSDFITSNSEAHAERAALVASGSSLTWREFDRRTRQVAQALKDAGLRMGDRVVIVMANGFAMAEAMFGVMRAGMIVVPLNTTVSDETLHLLLRDADPALVIATPEHTSRLEAIASSIRRIVADGVVAGWPEFGEWRDAASAEPAPSLDANEPCNIIYSSGTTGAPKGIVHTHKGRVDWAYDLALALRYRDGARSLIATGLYSNISWATLLSTIVRGGTIFIHSAFEPEAVLKTIAAEAITNLGMVPLQLQRMVDHPDFSTTDKSSLQGVMSVGSPLPAKLKEQLLSDPPCGVLDAWGLTEGIITVLPPE
ncbi:MAG TPA: AMP-binding protein, partial [Sphingomicrobium sp.]|nr:AMP-binding protein [Sphingomicrobium sp.]